MREKKNYHVLTFHTTAAAMAMERFCAAYGIGGRLIPVPREISAGCGLAWRMLPEDFPALEEYLEGEEEKRVSAGNVRIDIEDMVVLSL